MRREQLKDSPDHHDADLVLKIYDLRREAVMRESRSAINARFWPKSADDVVAVVGKTDHPLNAAFRQVSGYWEMVYGMARHGIVHADYLVESNGEGLFFYARVEPYLDELRSRNPRAFVHTEWITKNSEVAGQMLTMFRARVAKALESK